MSLERRLRVLEDHAPEPGQDRTEVRAWMKASLDHIAALRRSDSPEDRAERERARRRGEGSR